jgi:serine/threonine protein kinase
MLFYIQFFGRTVKICDFGLSRMKSTDSTTPGPAPYMAGTLQYVAPEVHVDHYYPQYYSDVWAMGITSVNWLTGKRAWDLPTDTNLHQRILFEKKTAKAMPDRLVDVPEVIRDLIEISLSYNVRARPSAAQIEQHLAGLVRGKSMHNIILGF